MKTKCCFCGYYGGAHSQHCEITMASLSEESKYSNEYVELLEQAAAEMQMCLELMISIVDPNREPLITREVTLSQSNLALESYLKVLRDFNAD